MRRPGCGKDYERARAVLLASHPPCVYCGAPATTADHVPPLCELPPGQWRGRLVPACLRCNQRRGGWRLVNARRRRRAVERVAAPAPSRVW